MKILVVDDEPHITHMLRFLFEKRGHVVVTASDGEAALERIRAEQPDLVFLDLNLPKKSGFQVCEEIRKEEHFRSLPIYMLTAQGQDVSREKGLIVGATGYILKPFAPSQLVALLETVKGDLESKRQEKLRP